MYTFNFIIQVVVARQEPLEPSFASQFLGRGLFGEVHVAKSGLAALSFISALAGPKKLVSGSFPIVSRFPACQAQHGVFNVSVRWLAFQAQLCDQNYTVK